MSSVKESIAKRINGLGLRAPVYRTARKLLDLAHPDNGLVRLTYDEALDVVETTADNTVRSHLVQLAAADLITYRRNAVVSIYFHHWTDVVQPDDPPARDSRAQRSKSTSERSQDEPENLTDDEEVIAERSKSISDGSQARDLIADGSKSTSERSNRALSDQPIGGYRQARQAIHDDPACQPKGGLGGKRPEPPEIERSVTLLTDIDVGLDEEMATRIAQRYSFDAIRAHVFRYLRDRAAAAGKNPAVRSPAVIETRLRKGWPATITESDKRSELWDRHAAEDEREDSEAARRAKYIPDEYSDIIIG
jgi:hypothetical protein